MFIVLLFTFAIIGVAVAFLLGSLDFGSSDPSVTYSALPSVSTSKTSRPAMLNAALNVACDLAMRDFIYSWWRQYTDDENFPNHIRGLVAQAFQILSDDLSKVNWAVVFRQYIQIIRDKVIEPVSEEKQILPVVEDDRSSGDFDRSETASEYCRSSLRRVLQHIQPQEKTVNLMLEELLLSTVIVPLFDALRPESLNQMLLDLLNSDSEAIHCVISEWIEAQTCTEQGNDETDFRQGLSTDPALRPSAASSVWKVDIVKAMIRFDPKPYVVYCIEIRYGQSYWEICRRYNDFVKLHNQIRRQVGSSFTGQLPKRNFRDKFKKTFIETRRLELHRYLQQAIACPECLQISTLFEWLSPRSSDQVYVASPIDHDLSKEMYRNRLSTEDMESGIFKEMEILDAKDPNLRFLISDILSLLKSLLGTDISFRTKTGYRILYTYAPRAILKEMKKFTFNDFFSRILVWITTTMWPNGVLVENSPSNIALSQDERCQLQIKTEAAILRVLPKSVTVMLGQTACEKVVRNFVSILNHREKLSEAICIMLGTTVDHFVAQKKPPKDPAAQNHFYSAA